MVKMYWGGMAPTYDTRRAGAGTAAATREAERWPIDGFSSTSSRVLERRRPAGRGVPARHRGRRHLGRGAGRLHRPGHAAPDGGPSGSATSGSSQEPHKRPTRPGAGSLLDVSHDVEDGMITYRGLPAPVIRDHWTREESRRHFAPGTEFHIGRIEMVANTGTYVDSPFHRYADGRDLADLPLESLADLPGVVVRAAGRAGRGIDVAALAGLDVRGKAVLLHTGWDVHWRTERYFDGHPVPDRGRRRVAGRARRGAGRHRLPEHRRHRGPRSLRRTARSCGAGHPDRRASVPASTACPTRASASSPCR